MINLETVHGEEVYLPGKWYITSPWLKPTVVSCKTTLTRRGEKAFLKAKKNAGSKDVNLNSSALIKIMQTAEKKPKFL